MTKQSSHIEKSMLWRIYLCFFVLFAFAMAVLAKTLHVQGSEGEELNAQFEKKNIALKSIKATRGNIYAQSGSLLSTSVPIYDIYFDAKADGIKPSEFNKGVDKLAKQLTSLFKNNSKEYYKNLLTSARNKGKRYQIIKRNVRYKELQALKTFEIFKLGKYKGGLIIEPKQRREKPFKSLAARTIGYANQSAQVGLEGAYNDVLAGKEGKRLMKRINKGVWMPLSDANQIDPEEGLDILSTIDVNLQDVAHQALLNQLTKHNADHGCVAVMHVNSGDVKAIANLSINEDGSYSEKYNYVIGESTEPGSTFKLASIAVALEDGFVSIDDSVQTGEGSYDFMGSTMKDSKKGGYGKITLARAIEVSSNIGIAKTIVEHYSSDPQKFIDGLYKLGLNQPTGIEISGEGKPFIKSTSEQWSGISLPWISHGYEVSLTPLQILTFYNAIANNGKAVRPRFVKAILNKNNTEQNFETYVLNERICSEKTAKNLQKMLEGVVENGTAKNLKNAHFKIAGKTGTAQIYNEKYGYKYASKVSYQASFVGYFPAENPTYSCIVVVNAPSNNVYYGNLVAGPIFKEVADKVYATALELHPTATPKPTAQYPAPFTAFHQDAKSIYQYLYPKAQPLSHTSKSDLIQIKESETFELTLNHKSKKVPNVIGMSIKDALYVLESRGLNVSFRGNGKVVAQSIKSGSLISKHNNIHLTLF